MKYSGCEIFAAYNAMVKLGEKITGDQNDIFIASVYNDADKIGAQIHTVCISKEDDGSYTVYNAYKQDKDHNYVEKGGYKSLSDAIGDISTNPQLISLIYIDQLELGDFPFFDKHIAIA